METSYYFHEINVVFPIVENGKHWCLHTMHYHFGYTDQQMYQSLVIEFTRTRNIYGFLLITGWISIDHPLNRIDYYIDRRWWRFPINQKKEKISLRPHVITYMLNNVLYMYDGSHTCFFSLSLYTISLVFPLFAYTSFPLLKKTDQCINSIVLYSLQM